METLLIDWLANIDLSYIILCNISNYIIIESIQTGHKMTTFAKRLLSAGIAIVLAVCMLGMDHQAEPIFYGFFVQFITWDYVFKGLMRKIQKKYSPDDGPSYDPNRH